MADLDEKLKASKKRKRNMVAKSLRDSGDKRGAFALKVINPKKTEYKRKKLNPRVIGEEDE